MWTTRLRWKIESVEVSVHHLSFLLILRLRLTISLTVTGSVPRYLFHLIPFLTIWSTRNDC